MKISIVVFNWRKKAGKKGKFTLFCRKSFIGTVFNFVARFFAKTLHLNELGMAYERMQRDYDPSKRYFEQFVRAFQLTINVNRVQLASINNQSPVIFYANHPLSGIDAFAIASELEKIRDDIKVVAASYLASIPGIKDNAFIMNMGKSRKTKIKNRPILDEINKHIKEGKSLLIFPSGSVSRWFGKDKTYAIDPPWKKGIIHFGNQSKNTKYIPIFVNGEPSRKYLKLRQWSTFLSNFYVFREFARQIGSELHFKLGEEINKSDLLHLNMKEKLMHLRSKIYEMKL